MRLGAHMSIQGGFDRAVERACSVDATALHSYGLWATIQKDD